MFNFIEKFFGGYSYKSKEVLPSKPVLSPLCQKVISDFSKIDPTKWYSDGIFWNHPDLIYKVDYWPTYFNKGNHSCYVVGLYGELSVDEMKKLGCVFADHLSARKSKIDAEEREEKAKFTKQILESEPGQHLVNKAASPTE